MNIAYFIFQLFHIRNLLTLYILTPLHSPCTSSTDYAHLSTDYNNTFDDYTNFSIDCAQIFYDCVNTPNDRANIVVDLADMPNMSFLNLYIPNPT
jgi:hypothetical protein